MIKMIAILKYGKESFTHGVAPVSFQWNTSNPSVLQLNYPQKNEVDNLVTVSRKVRNNDLNDNNAVFSTQFNSSTVYSTGSKPGEAQVSV